MKHIDVYNPFMVNILRYLFCGQKKYETAESEKACIGEEQIPNVEVTQSFEIGRECKIAESVAFTRQLLSLARRL